MVDVGPECIDRVLDNPKGRVLQGHMLPSVFETVESVTPLLQTHSNLSSRASEGTQGHAVCTIVFEAEDVIVVALAFTLEDNVQHWPPAELSLLKRVSGLLLFQVNEPEGIVKNAELILGLLFKAWNAAECKPA